MVKFLRIFKCHIEFGCLFTILILPILGHVTPQELNFVWKKTVFLELYRIQRPGLSGGYETVMDIYKTTVKKALEGPPGFKEGK